MDNKNFKVLESEIIFSGKVFDLQVDQIEYKKSGNKARREVAVHPGGAVILPVTKENKIIFVRQFRYPHKINLLELPAGKLEKGEEPVLCAIRELKEETGYTSDKIIKLGAIHTTPGFCSEILHIFLAEDLTAGDHQREEGEQDMEMIEIAPDEAVKKVIKGEITDAKTICGLFYYQHRNTIDH